MSKCRNCNVEISDETERCPLCGSVLEYTGEVENMYPDVRVHTRKMTMISKIYLFCALWLRCCSFISMWSPSHRLHGVRSRGLDSFTDIC